MKRAAFAMGLLSACSHRSPPPLHVTEGVVETDRDLVRIDAPAVRAVLRESTAADIELHFTYRGPTATRGTLASGDSRIQIGAKLRAADSCNVVYAMLRIEPEPKIVVQVKENPGKHMHADCKNDGYRTVRPEKSEEVPEIAVGSAHRLRAALHEQRLDVWLDDRLTWTGGIEMPTFDGPVGLRTDNGRFDVKIKAAR